MSLKAVILIYSSPNTPEGYDNTVVSPKQQFLRAKSEILGEYVWFEKAP